MFRAPICERDWRPSCIVRHSSSSSVVSGARTAIRVTTAVLSLLKLRLLVDEIPTNSEDHYSTPTIEPIRRKIRVRGSTPENAPRIRAGMETKDQKAELKRTKRAGAMPKKPRFSFRRPADTARREARNHRSEDAKMLGPPPCGPQRTDRADQRDARGDANRDRSTQNHRRRVLLSATQRPRSTNNETTTTTRHPELRDPRPTHLTVDLGDWGLR